MAARVMPAGRFTGCEALNAKVVVDTGRMGAFYAYLEMLTELVEKCIVSTYSIGNVKITDVASEFATTLATTSNSLFADLSHGLCSSSVVQEN